MAVPPWEEFPEVNRVAVRRLLGLLVERAATLPGLLSDRGGGERGEHGDPAVGAAARQGAAAAP